MIRLFTALTLLVCSILTAQTKYEEGMEKAFALWSENKPMEAVALFERIGAAEKDQWLPYYYIALANTTESFTTQDKEKVPQLLEKAQQAQDKATALLPDNAELLVMQAMIHTAWIAYDPMTNGMKLSGTVNQIYEKALKLAPDNPRVVFCKAEFELGGAKYFGTDTAPICEQIKKSLTLFENFKPESPFHPKWGHDRAKTIAATCNQE